MTAAVGALLVVLHIALSGFLVPDAVAWDEAAANHGRVPAETARPGTKGWSEFV